MTNYSLKPLQTLPSLAWQDAKAKRKNVLAGVRQRRKIIYKNYLKKLSNLSLPTA